MEITQSILGVFKNSSAALAAIYTVGHIIIAMIVVTTFTGASLSEAGTVALIEPAINGCWFYILHKIWLKIHAD